MRKRHLPREETDAEGQWSFDKAALHAEVLFWRELIETSESEQPHESVERMRQALALAELKLQKACSAQPECGRQRGDS